MRILSESRVVLMKKKVLIVIVLLTSIFMVIACGNKTKSTSGTTLRKITFQVELDGIKTPSKKITVYKIDDIIKIKYKDITYKEAIDKLKKWTQNDFFEFAGRNTQLKIGYSTYSMRKGYEFTDKNGIVYSDLPKGKYLVSVYGTKKVVDVKNKALRIDLTNEDEWNKISVDTSNLTEMNPTTFSAQYGEQINFSFKVKIPLNANDAKLNVYVQQLPGLDITDIDVPNNIDHSDYNVIYNGDIPSDQFVRWVKIFDQPYLNEHQGQVVTVNVKAVPNATYEFKRMQKNDVGLYPDEPEMVTKEMEKNSAYLQVEYNDNYSGLSKTYKSPTIVVNQMNFASYSLANESLQAGAKYALGYTDESGVYLYNINRDFQQVDGFNFAQKLQSGTTTTKSDFINLVDASQAIAKFDFEAGINYNLANEKTTKIKPNAVSQVKTAEQKKLINALFTINGLKYGRAYFLYQTSVPNGFSVKKAIYPFVPYDHGYTATDNPSWQVRTNNSTRNAIYYNSDINGQIPLESNYIQFNVLGVHKNGTSDLPNPNKKNYNEVIRILLITTLLIVIVIGALIVFL